MDRGEVHFIASKYGRYLGGIDYNAVIDALEGEEERLREEEERLLGQSLGPAPQNPLGDALRLCGELERLREEEERCVEVVNEVKLMGLTKPHVDKAVRRLGAVRRRARAVRRALKYMGDPLKCL
ncbi:hypothetical protein GCM10007981_10140 [Thermocladium modestius]|uniref:Uncharacterized protein n=1 Tax=Thermocladium modestius TaxID=62609 RepID=A0A830GV91_9CREN|nr:hypothetical protein [Thermocladium modestius]GGP20760.1 hypothetical protein GCM10007981_10140 [Thermocladium modestius]